MAGAEGRGADGLAARMLATAVTGAEVGTFYARGRPGRPIRAHGAGLGICCGQPANRRRRVGQQSVTVTLDVAPLSEDVTVTAEGGRAEIREPLSPGRQRDPARGDRRAHADRRRAGGGGGGGRAPAAHEPDDGGDLRARPDREQGQRVRRRRALLDGAQRGGVNTFLDLIEPTGSRRIEILRGPNSAQYGSDALGGSVQFRDAAEPVARRPAACWRASAGLSAGTADELRRGDVLVGYSRSRLACTVNLAGRGAGDLRPGDGIDSHAAVTRFFGISSDACSDRLPDTGFSPVAAHRRARTGRRRRPRRSCCNYLGTRQDRRPTATTSCSAATATSSPTCDDLMLDLFYARYERIGAGWFDDASVDLLVQHAA